MSRTISIDESEAMDNIIKYKTKDKITDTELNGHVLKFETVDDRIFEYNIFDVAENGVDLPIDYLTETDREKIRMVESSIQNQWVGKGFRVEHVIQNGEESLIVNLGDLGGIVVDRLEDFNTTNYSYDIMEEYLRNTKYYNRDGVVRFETDGSFSSVVRESFDRFRYDKNSFNRFISAFILVATYILQLPFMFLYSLIDGKDPQDIPENVLVLSIVLSSVPIYIFKDNSLKPIGESYDETLKKGFNNIVDKQ